MNKKHYYFKGQVWEDGKGAELKFVSLTEAEADARDDIVPNPFYLLPEGHPKKQGATPKKVAKKATKKAVKKVVKKVEE